MHAIRRAFDDSSPWSRLHVGSYETAWVGACVQAMQNRHA
jgi:hypothetical protein